MATAATAVDVLVVRAAGSRAGAFAALVMLALPATSRYGHEARPNALSLLLVIMAVLVWDDNRLVARWRRQVLLVVFVVLAGAAHPYALLVMPVLVLTSTLAPREDRRREVIVTASVCAVSTVLLARSCSPSRNVPAGNPTRSRDTEHGDTLRARYP
jgi:hypothetical protein